MEAHNSRIYGQHKFDSSGKEKGDMKLGGEGGESGYGRLRGGVNMIKIKCMKF